MFKRDTRLRELMNIGKIDELNIGFCFAERFTKALKLLLKIASEKKVLDPQ